MPGPLANWLVVTVAFAVGTPALFGGYVYDDQVLVLRNAALQSGDLAALLGQPLFGAEQGFWRPITLLMLAAGHHAGGAFAIHLLALSLHAGNAALVFGLARRWSPPWRAALPALMFAVHPVQAESLGWCAAINDPLWVSFGLLAAHAALRWRDRRQGGAPWLATLALLSALLSKETGIAALPLVLLALGLVPGDGLGQTHWRSALATLVGTTVGWLVLRTIVIAQAATPAMPAVTTTNDADASGSIGDAVTLFGAQLQLLVAPLPATPFRSLPELTATGQGMLALGLMALLVALAVCAHRARHQRSALWFGLALTLLPLLPPVSNWRSIGAHPVNDRYLYLCVFGAALMLTTREWLWRRRWLATLAWLGIAVAGGVTLTQFGKWHSQRDLAEYAIGVAPTDPTLLVMAGDVALERARSGDPAAWITARSNYQSAIEHTPRIQNGTARRTLSAGLLGIAWCDLMQPGIRRQPPKTLIAGFEAATRTGVDNPAAWVGLGVACGSFGRPERARQAFARALEIDPDHREALYNRAFLEIRLGNLAAARRHIDSALQVDPTNAAIRELARQLPPGPSGR
ncbi:MAG: tetratricopeptide repeat protein [bacterium]|nr:tetratricopeptide repeat protein [bacterium]